MRTLKHIVKFIIFMIEDFMNLLKSQNDCEQFDMAQIILFGLLINALYGVMHNFNLVDLLIVLFSSYGIMRFRKDIKDREC